MSRLLQKITYEDYAAFLPDLNTYQIIDGELYVTPAPSPYHQRASKRLQRQLEEYFEAPGQGEVFDAPIDVILTNHDIVQPDIVVVTRPEQVSRRGIEGAPLLLVEVLSPSSVKTDRTVKFARYASLGVGHYWILDSEIERLECYRATSGSYVLVTDVTGPARLTHPDFPQLVIDLHIVWSD